MTTAAAIQQPTKQRKQRASKPKKAEEFIMEINKQDLKTKIALQTLLKQSIEADRDNLKSQLALIETPQNGAS